MYGLNDELIEVKAELAQTVLELTELKARRCEDCAEYEHNDDDGLKCDEGVHIHELDPWKQFCCIYWKPKPAQPGPR